MTDRRWRRGRWPRGPPPPAAPGPRRRTVPGAGVCPTTGNPGDVGQERLLPSLSGRVRGQEDHDRPEGTPLATSALSLRVGLRVPDLSLAALLGPPRASRLLGREQQRDVRLPRAPAVYTAGARVSGLKRRAMHAGGRPSAFPTAFGACSTMTSKANVPFAAKRRPRASSQQSWCVGVWVSLKPTPRRAQPRSCKLSSWALSPGTSDV